MKVIIKSITEKKPNDKMEQPLVVDDPVAAKNAAIESNVAMEQGGNPGDRARGYIILRRRVAAPFGWTTICLLITALLVMCIGIMCGLSIYKKYASAPMYRFRTGWYNIKYEDTDRSAQPFISHESSIFSSDDDSFKILPKERIFKERFDIDLDDQSYEKIDVPDFQGGRKGRFIHDFNVNKTGIIDIEGHMCFVMPLNRQRVLPPRNLYDLLDKMYYGYYEVNTETVRETMHVVTPPLSDISSVGVYIAKECNKFPIYALEKYDDYKLPKISKRSINDYRVFGQFAGKDIVEFEILGLEDLDKKQNN